MSLKASNDLSDSSHSVRGIKQRLNFKGIETLNTWRIGSANVSILDVLENKLASPLSLCDFQAYCVDNHTEENLRFWLVATAWTRGLQSSSDENITAKTIINEWIGEQAVNPINISSVVENSILKLAALNEFPPHIFEEACQQIFSIICRDIFPRFACKVNSAVDLAQARSAALWFLHLDEIKSLTDFFQFPQLVNEAFWKLMLVLIAVEMTIFLIVGWYSSYWQIIIFSLYSYFVRLISGPRLDPNCWIVLFIIYPVVNKYQLLENKLVASNPKRFTLLIGLLFSIFYVIVMVFDPLVARIVLMFHILQTIVAAIFGVCSGCFLYRILLNLKHHLLPPQVHADTILSDVADEHIKKQSTDIRAERIYSAALPSV